VTGQSTFAIPQLAVQKGIDAGAFHERPGYGRDEMAFNLWALVHGLSMLRVTRMRYMDADYERCAGCRPPACRRPGRHAPSAAGPQGAAG
jgi:hypothetical protein